MKQHFERLLVTLLLLGFCIVFAITGCNTAHGPSDKGGTSSSTITFVDEQGNTLGTQTVSSTGSVDFDYKKEGYKGAFFNSDGVQVYSGQFTTKKDCKITVKLTPITYTVKFARASYSSGAYGTFSGPLPDDMVCTYDVEYTLPVNALTYEYYGTKYKARGWTKTEENFNQKGEYKSGAKIKNVSKTDGEVITLYACFNNDDSFELKFYKSDNTYSIDTVSVYADKGEVLSDSQIPVATAKTGYVFKGYYLDGDASQSIIDFTKYTVTGKATFRPKFTPASYTATFVTERGTAPAPLTWTYSDSYYGADIRIDSGVYALTATGYSFDGWYKDGAWSKTTYIDRHTDTQDMTLTAKWTLWTARIYYEKNAPAGVSVNGSMYDEQFSYGTAKNLSKNKYFANGYKFTGWNTKDDGTGTAYADEASFTWSGSANNENIYLYARWEKLQTPIDISVGTPPTHSDISLTYDSTNTRFKAELAGASTFKWYIDGVAVENEMGATLSAYALSAGHHSVMVTTELAGRTYGTTLSVTVTVN
ncbi:repeat protein [Treponema vincentii ATCC 35580]|uniref:Repeat protein n=1 Tax=Treponema vincentii ATCC 35580 TaxID=596324 RepID=C8PQN1_9SPIR|nr:InlB B-repeat-containing protein [Treponema vincentii]EEV20386.1 repeat protein [Treponema vincentii ATCC 35580]